MSSIISPLYVLVSGSVTELGAQALNHTSWPVNPRNPLVSVLCNADIMGSYYSAWVLVFLVIVFVLFCFAFNIDAGEPNLGLHAFTANAILMESPC